MRPILFLALLLNSLAIAQESPSPIAVPAVPPLDIEANVRKMLQEGRTRQPQEEKRAADAPVAAEPVAPSPKPVAPKTEAAAPPAAKQTPAETKSGAKQQAQPKPSAREEVDFVPVPEMTITIRSVKDVDSVAKQLENARKQKEGEKPAVRDEPKP